ncbi:uncharacterized protein DUF2752 [Flavobacterium glaciei]|uniref:Uncharacterized protein DUF2752 n=2 Tax=Flavobacterium glaciei TaxID=386300 RepID=A0A562PJV2_9FLAO|nr:uncharacterized protein DUF2752 [Flavobacterium glaciei]TWI44731.1 uncharacterized protein DUF2752 [Flavobacterium glaciei]
MKLSKTNLNTAETYNLANKMLLFILLSMFLYPLLTAYLNLGFSCQYKLIFGTECRSCGLTRGLRNCLKFDFSTANKFNAQSTFVFLIIIIQIILRISLIFILKNKYLSTQKNIIKIASFDVFIIISLLIFNLKYYG